MNALVVVGLWTRPRGFVAAFALLTAQQIVSHGAAAVRMWQDEHRVDFASLSVLVVIPLTLALLLIDARARRSPTR